jgi:hypothetical protein
MLQKMARGQLGVGAESGDVQGSDSHRNTVTAKDFRYDRTGLPRYPDNVAQVMSSLTTSSDDPNAIGSSCGIVTTSSFDTVAKWYAAHLPPGWKMQRTDDFAGLANKSSAALLQMLNGRSNAEAPATSNPPAPAIGIAMFNPPPGTPGNLGIMVTSQNGKVIAMMKKSVGL